jgi:endonuclease YncB( thermonuclease family)
MTGIARRITLLAALLPAPAMAGERMAMLPPCAAGPAIAGGIAAAIDGDTVRLADGRTARLAGIEVAKGDAALAAAARDALAAYLARGAVAAAPIGPADRYGRLRIAATLPDAGSAQIALAAQGLARMRANAAELACLPGLAAAEATARAAGRNLWSRPEFGIRRADDPSLLQQIGLYALVEGRVVSVGRRSRTVFIDFGRNWRQDFTVMMNTSVADGIAKAGLAVDSLAGRRIRVRGTIEASGGPAIRIEDAAAIELLDE